MKLSPAAQKVDSVVNHLVAYQGFFSDRDHILASNILVIFDCVLQMVPQLNPYSKIGGLVFAILLVFVGFLDKSLNIKRPNSKAYGPL